MAKPPARAAPPRRQLQAPALRVDPEKYPNLRINPGLERALRIRQELEKGRPRDEAERLADEAMGREPAKPAKARPKATGRSAKVAGRAKAHAAKRLR
jgi:hypothetical protein